LLDEDKYFWVSNTPAEKGAFDNQCAKCGNGSNSTHGSNIGIDGINRSNRDTPIYCNKCHSLLPRPWVKENGEYRLMKGFTSAYKRMSWDQPSPALTRNISYACSDNKLHPEQNRVLSLYEACLLHTITDYNYKWIRADGKNVSDKLIRELIGESIPPRGLEVILNFILQTMVSKGKIQVSYPRNQRNKPKSRQIDFFKMA
jgi:DNA (cytosine-5)-methyltransferase 1